MRMMVFVAVFLLCGCVSVVPVSNIPIEPEEFNQPLDEIKNQYSGVEKFEPKEFKFEWFPDRQFLDITELKKLWGEPENIETNWGSFAGGHFLNAGMVAADLISLPVFGFTSVLFAYPGQKYHWSKYNIHIEAHVIRRGFEGYAPLMLNWKWSEVNKE